MSSPNIPKAYRNLVCVFALRPSDASRVLDDPAKHLPQYIHDLGLKDLWTSGDKETQEMIYDFIKDEELQGLLKKLWPFFVWLSQLGNEDFLWGFQCEVNRWSCNTFGSQLSNSHKSQIAVSIHRFENRRFAGKLLVEYEKDLVKLFDDARIDGGHIGYTEIRHL